MTGLSDQQLLHDYAEHRSEAAFAELVRRHIDPVYSAALRMVRDSHLAEDVTQGAFLALAQNAGRLADRSVLSGWLHVTAQNLAAKAVQAAPTSLAVTVSAAALLKGTAFATSATVTSAKTIAMTTMQKALIGAAAAALMGVTFYQARQAARLRASMEALQQQTAPLGNEVEQLERERDAATNRLAALAAEVGRSSNNSAELLRLRGDVGRLRAESQALARLAVSGSGAEPGSEEAAWLERVRLLKQTVDRTAGARIPEFQFLTQYDWLTAANHKLETEEDYLMAFRGLRSMAVDNFVRTAAIVLQKYVQANNGQFPTDLGQLKPFFETAPPDEVLERYKLVPPGDPRGADPGRNTNEWAITLKSPQDEGNWTVTPGGSSTFVDNPQMTILAPAMKAALDAAPVINGAKRIDIHQLAPYLTTPEQKAAYEGLLRNSK